MLQTSSTILDKSLDPSKIISLSVKIQVSVPASGLPGPQGCCDNDENLTFTESHDYVPSTEFGIYLHNLYISHNQLKG